MFGLRVVDEGSLFLIQSAARDSHSFALREAHRVDPVHWDGPVGLAHAKAALVAEREAFDQEAGALWCGEQDAWWEQIEYLRSLVPNCREWEWWQRFEEPYPVS